MQVYRQTVLGLFALLFSFSLSAQEGTIYLSNPSFEDLPRHSHVPREWTDCGFPGESPPDVQPELTFSVSKPPFHGSTYLGMVVRDNDTWEAIAQPLSQPMVKGQCYQFSINLSRSELYLSQSRITNDAANYNTPAKLRIFGGFSPCDKAYLLAESDLVINYGWMEFNFKMKPIANYTHIVLEAFYQTPTLFPYNGNILLDNASALRPISCQEEIVSAPRNPANPAAAPSRPPTAPNVAARSPQTPATPPATRPATPPAPAEVTLSGVRRSDMRTGQTIRIENLQFESDSSAVRPESYTVLNEIYRFLSANPDVVVEIGGHTNSWPDNDYADRLSTARAKAVADYLAGKGISRDRLQYKGYGKRNPIDTNETSAGRRRNQRVEIKIIGFNG